VPNCVSTSAATHAPEPPLRENMTATQAIEAARVPVTEIARATERLATWRRNGSSAHRRRQSGHSAVTLTARLYEAEREFRRELGDELLRVTLHDCGQPPLASAGPACASSPFG
jgi:hypothetical protein